MGIWVKVGAAINLANCLDEAVFNWGCFYVGKCEISNEYEVINI